MPASADPRTIEPTTSTLTPVATRANGTAAPGSIAQKASSATATEPGREEPCGGIEALADERCAVTRAQQRETYRHQRAAPEDESAGEEGQPGEPTHGRRPGIVARGQPNREREERRTQHGCDADCYARIALA